MTTTSRSTSPKAPNPKHLYGDAGDRYPVEVGDVWQIGKHILACGDLEMGAGVEFLATYVRGGRPDVSFVDPPWNAGNARSFRTKAGVGRAVNFYRLISKVLETLAKSRRDVFIEMGVSECDNVRARLEEYGARLLDTWDITYYRKNPCRLLWGTFTGQAYPRLLDCNRLDDEVATPKVIAAAAGRGDIVFDPCMGRGLSAVSALRAGATAAGLELNPRRLAVTIDKLASLGAGAERGQEPRRIAVLSCMTGAAEATEADKEHPTNGNPHADAEED
jgi:hypothetical protein